jgi:pyruvate carboxylase subunit B
MMKDAGILDRYESVLAEFPVVVRAGGAWTSVTPGSQQYWLQAFNNVLRGRWNTIDEGYGRAVLGYFGRTPLPPDPDVLAAASTQLGLPPFDGDPLEAAPDALQEAIDALRARHLPVNDENIFLVAAAIVPGKNMDVNEGIRLLSGTPKIAVPLKSKEGSGAGPETTFTMPFSTSCTVKEGGSLRRFVITIEPPAGVGIRVAGVRSEAQEPTGRTLDGATPVYSPLPGRAELIQLAVKVGDRVQPGQVVASVEVMKAKHEVTAPLGGRVVRIEATLGSQVAANMPIMLIAQSSDA